MIVGSGSRNFFGILGSSVMNQPPMFTSPAVGLNNSMASTSGGSVCASSSLTRIAGMFGSASPAPGEPFTTLLERQLSLSPHVPHGAFSLTMTKENPNPSVTGYQELA